MSVRVYTDIAAVILKVNVSGERWLGNPYKDLPERVE
jgi:hypothetical protein